MYTKHSQKKKWRQVCRINDKLVEIEKEKKKKKPSQLVLL